jgi:N-acetylneuraminic acid mutarotase
MATARAYLNAVLLADGRVLVVGSDTGAEVWDPATGAWHTTESLNNPRTAFAAVSLADGRALVTGGLNDIQQSYSSAYVYDPRPGQETWSKVGLMDTARSAPSAAVLPDGRVLVAGGYFHVEPTSHRDSGPDTVFVAYRGGSSAESPPPRPPLADIVPPNVGAALATAELFDPATGSWSLTGSLTYARVGAAAVTLADGRVLIVGSGGGIESGVTVDPHAFDSAEIYDPQTGRFSLAGQLPEVDRSALAALGIPLPEGDAQPNDNGTLVALNDGGALLVAHGGWWKHQGQISRSFRFDPQTESWREVGQPFAITWDHSTGQGYETPGVPRTDALVASLPDGRVLVAGGGDLIEHPYGTATPITNRSAELYDPTTDTWSPLQPMLEPRAGGAAVVLTDGSVLLVGGHAQRAPCGQLPDPPCGEPSTRQMVLASAIRFVPSQ